MSVLTVGETADRLRVSRRTVKRMLKDGRLTGFRIGGNGDWRVMEDSLPRPERPARPGPTKPRTVTGEMTNLVRQIEETERTCP